MGRLIQDVRQAMRLLRRTPGLTAVAVLSLAITIGITAVVFTALKAVIIDPLPYSNSGELVMLRSYGRAANWVSWADMQDIGQRNRSFQSVGTYKYALLNIRGDASNPPQALYGLFVSASLFPTLGVSPLIGRNILPEEDQPGRGQEIILSFGLWKRRFNEDRNILGQKLTGNGREYTVIGVMPPGFDFPLRLATSIQTPSPYMEFWAPIAQDPSADAARNAGFGGVARMKQGVTRIQVEQDLAIIGEELAREHPSTNKNREYHALPLEAQALGNSRPMLLILMAAAGMFMLIGCSNVANLLLARSLGRQREIALRLALGAGRGRIVRQLITESCVLALAGGFCGYLLTWIAWKLLPAIVPQSIPRLGNAQPDWTVFAFTLAIAVANGFIFGIVPAVRTASGDPAMALREGGRGSIGSRSRLRAAFVVAEVAITVVLVIAGGTLLASFVRLMRSDLGFDPDHVLASIIVPLGDSYNTPQQRGVFWKRLLDNAKTLPGVESVGAVDALPFSGENFGAFIRTAATPDAESTPANTAEFDRITAGYLPTLRVRLVQGRMFTPEDELNSAPFAIIDENFASRFFSHEDPLGKRFCVNCVPGKPEDWKQVIGVVASIKHYSIEGPADPEAYVTGNAVQGVQFLVLRTRGRSTDLANPLRRLAANIDPNVPVYLSAEFSRLVGDTVSDRRFTMALLAITGILALLLAAAGVYAVMSYATSSRTQEIGIRVALGATRRNVEALVLRDGMMMVGVGIAAGLVGALAVTRLLRGSIAGLGSADPVTIVVSVALVAATALVACLLPARRATRVDPMVALRHE